MLDLFNPFRWKARFLPWQEMDWWLFALPVGLSVFGGVMIRSTELNTPVTDWWQHWLITGIGVVIMLFLARCRYENLIDWHWYIYGVTNVLLIAVMILGYSAKGAQRWISIGGFNFQPSEFAKLGLIITLAALLHSEGASNIFSALRALGVTVVPWLLVFIQPDLGTSLVFGAIVLGMLYWGNANPGWLILLVSPLVSAIVFNAFLLNPYSPEWIAWAVLITWSTLMSLIAWRTLPWRWTISGAFAVNILGGEIGHLLWGVLKEYQKNRLILFLNPEKDPLGGGYHLIQSRIAIGSGQVWGRGLHNGTQTQLHFIPEQHTDFIFSAIGEELGFVGCILVMVVFWLICLRLIILAENAKDNFGSLLAIGVLAMIVFQVIVNIGMTIGLAPVTGIPLPWVSYGRSAMLTNFISLGLVESVANYRQRLRF